ncbi:MAG: hypothetical protein BWX80_03516 [Candidatus Hydrogenedentes bacterium ADurb.Bin101]|nr:MAG: hypothetical protein BWX80_03516 [Candidatus Hydrogenedentes bacterium ADurb.Bin101]
MPVYPAHTSRLGIPQCFLFNRCAHFKQGTEAFTGVQAVFARQERVPENEAPGFISGVTGNLFTGAVEFHDFSPPVNQQDRCAAAVHDLGEEIMLFFQLAPRRFDFRSAFGNVLFQGGVGLFQFPPGGTTDSFQPVDDPG